VNKVAVLKKGSVLSHYIFTSPYPWNLLTKSERSCANHHGLQWEAGMVPYSMARHLITSTVVDIEDNDAVVYVKGYQKTRVGEGHVQKWHERWYYR